VGALLSLWEGPVIVRCPLWLSADCGTPLQPSDGSRKGDPGTLEFGVAAHLRVVHGLSATAARLQVANHVKEHGWQAVGPPS
jgi:hypothetical protein